MTKQSVEQITLPTIVHKLCTCRYTKEVVSNQRTFVQNYAQIKKHMAIKWFGYQSRVVLGDYIRVHIAPTLKSVRTQILVKMVY